jgi:hypothetical protein
MSAAQLDLIDELARVQQLRRMTHRGGRRTEVQAAESVLRGLSALQQQVLDAFDEFHQLTAEQAESLPCFAHLGPSTVRKRLSELAKQGKLVACGTQLNSRGKPMTVWKCAP